jgi:cell division protein FtsB
MHPVLQHVWKFVKNPFLTSTVVFSVWMVFFDSNSYFDRQAQLDQLRELENQQDFYKEEIERISDELQSIDDDPEELEKFAREKFFFKEQGEDIFVLEEKP